MRGEAEGKGLHGVEASGTWSYGVTWKSSTMRNASSQLGSSNMLRPWLVTLTGRLSPVPNPCSAPQGTLPGHLTARVSMFLAGRDVHMHFSGLPIGQGTDMTLFMEGNMLGVTVKPCITVGPVSMGSGEQGRFPYHLIYRRDVDLVWVQRLPPPLVSSQALLGGMPGHSGTSWHPPMPFCGKGWRSPARSPKSP